MFFQEKVHYDTVFCFVNLCSIVMLAKKQHIGTTVLHTLVYFDPPFNDVIQETEVVFRVNNS